MAQFSDSPADRRPSGRRRLTKFPVAVAAAAALGIVAIGVAAVITWPAMRNAAAGHSAKGAAPAPPAASVPPIPTNPLLPARGDLLGAWVQPTAGFSSTGVEQSIRSFEHLLGRKLAIDSLYAAWGKSIPLSVARWDLRGGRVPMLTWGTVSTKAIVSGRYDSRFRTVARELRAVGGPILLRFFPEMSNAFLRRKAISGPDFVAAWRHVFDIFKAEHASNVQWVWCPTTEGYRLNLATEYYPGDAYVNWIGADGFNWGTVMPGSKWRSFTKTFSHFYQWAQQRPKPLIIAEFGSAEGTGGAKATWLRQAASALETAYPRIRAIVYFNSQHLNFGYTFNWKVTSSPSALAAFRAIATNPFFTARPVLGRAK